MPESNILIIETEDEDKCETRSFNKTIVLRILTCRRRGRRRDQKINGEEKPRRREETAKKKRGNRARRR